MTLKQLEAFYWAATLGTFAIAAERLHVTQSTLSKRIAELEDSLGNALFDRSGQRAQLTPAGTALLPRVRAMLDLENDIRETLARGEVIEGRCHVGISELSATTWFPAFVAAVGQQYPLLQIHPQVGLTKELERLVERGKLDCAVVTGSSVSAELHCETIAEVDFSWMASPARLKRGTVLDAARMALHPVIASSVDSGLAEPLQAWATHAGVQLREVLPCNSLTTILAMTVAGMGISFLPRHYVQPLVRRKMLVELRSDPPLPTIAYRFIRRRDDTRQLVARMRAAVVQEIDFDMPNPLWSAGSG
ncbi:LysR family transcriptional regulator [Pulveribacter sp.]|uniref:LysR family transcriptional regulator n=1 Tax=Pulveribacter sp. TaxID=2678893 RepID=UPI0028A7E7EE|nr:LysR family transcriptional regulator [Pulveribacter sp.]